METFEYRTVDIYDEIIETKMHTRDAVEYQWDDLIHFETILVAGGRKLTRRGKKILRLQKRAIKAALRMDKIDCSIIAEAEKARGEI